MRVMGTVPPAVNFLVGFLVSLSVGLGAMAASAEPLSPGRPAGIRQARIESGSEALMIGTGAAIMVAVGILASKDFATVNSLQIGSQAAVTPPTTTTTVSTSTTS